jgi:LuxR family maltose regulon positive regulatory protein
VGYVRELLERLEPTASEARGPTHVASVRPATPPTGTSADPLLTPREYDVLRLLATELSMREIAQELYIAKSTVRSHVKHIYSKLNAHSRMEALVRAQELKLL